MIFNTDALKALIKFRKPNGEIGGLSLRDYLDKKARCGCGQDCCDNTFHIIDQVTKVHYVWYLCSGTTVVQTYEDYLANGIDCETAATEPDPAPTGATGATGATGETGATGVQ